MTRRGRRAVGQPATVVSGCWCVQRLPSAALQSPGSAVASSVPRSSVPRIGVCPDIQRVSTPQPSRASLRVLDLTERTDGKGRVVPLRARRKELSVRERRVLELIAQGLTHAEIAKRLSEVDRSFTATETVKSIERCAIAKLQTRSPAHAVAVGMRLGLIG
jgi:DNA-binding CsgD family transcriptional regulator